MRFENGGIELEYGWADRVFPSGSISWRADLAVPVRVRPSHPRNSVILRYRVTGRLHSPITVRSPSFTRDGADHFELPFKSLRAGDVVEYGVVCVRGRQRVPPPPLASELPCSFTVTDAAARAAGSPDDLESPVAPVEIDVSPLDSSATTRSGWLTAIRDAVGPVRTPRKPPAAGHVVAAVKVAASNTRSLYRTAFTAHATGSPQAEDVVWVDGDDELLVHTSKVRVAFSDGFVVVGIPVFSEQSGEAEVVVSLAVGRQDEPTGLVIAAETIPRGPAAVVERWGDPLVAAAWAALVELSVHVAAAAGVDDQNQPLVPTAIVAHGDGIDVTPQARYAIDRKRL